MQACCRYPSRCLMWWLPMQACLLRSMYQGSSEDAEEVPDLQEEHGAQINP